MRYETICPVCESSKVNIVSNFFVAPDEPLKFAFVPGVYLVSCDKCGTPHRFPLEVYDEADFTKSGESYYNRVSSDSSEQARFENAVKDHLEMGQKHHYETLRSKILSKYPEHRVWLDVGSAGAPTAFEDYDFTTIEPDARVVEFSKRYFNNNKIVCNAIEYFKPEKKFDGVAFMHSLYCIPTPKVALTKAHALLNNDGLLVVAIGDYFMGTKSPFSGNGYERIEDVFRGSTMNVYYNSYSICYLAQSCGFELMADEEHVHETSLHKGMSSRFFIFRKISNKIDEGLLQTKSKEYVLDKFEQFHKNIFDRTVAQAKNLDKDNTLFIGDFGLFSQLNSVRSFENILGFFDYRFETETTVNGIKTGCIRDSLKCHENINVVVCSFKDPFGAINENIEKILEIYGDSITILVPTRMASENSIFGQTSDWYGQKMIRQFTVVEQNLLSFIDMGLKNGPNVLKLIAKNELSELGNVRKIAIAGSKRAGKEAVNFAKILGIEIVCFIDDNCSGVHQEFGLPIIDRVEFAGKFKNIVDLIVMGQQQAGFDGLEDLMLTLRLNRCY